MGWEHGEPEPGEGFFLVIHAGLRENWDWLEMGGWDVDTASEAVRYSATQRGRDDSRRLGGPNRMAIPSENVSGSQTRGLTHMGLMKCM